MHRRTYMSAIGGVLTAGLLAGCTSEGEPAGTAGGEAQTTTEEDIVGSDTPKDGVEILWAEFYAEDYSSGVEGEIKNNSDETLSMVTVNVHFFDSSGSRLEDSLDNISDLGAGQRWKFDAPYIGTTQPAEYEVRVDVTDF